MTRRAANRQQMVEACTTIARTVMKTSIGLSAAVQRMLDDPEARGNLIRQAVDHVSAEVDRYPTDERRAAQKTVLDATRTLSLYAGRPL